MSGARCRIKICLVNIGEGAMHYAARPERRAGAADLFGVSRRPGDQPNQMGNCSTHIASVCFAPLVCVCVCRKHLSVPMTRARAREVIMMTNAAPLALSLSRVQIKRHTMAEGCYYNSTWCMDAETRSIDINIMKNQKQRERETRGGRDLFSISVTATSLHKHTKICPLLQWKSTHRCLTLWIVTEGVNLEHCVRQWPIIMLWSAWVSLQLWNIQIWSHKSYSIWRKF